ncbi:uncharacterized protein LOC119377808 [Rhipicephalus sanguineus]|uniref:uncharacterized protein LOC119377808 n=1 Tax=Rhipicephalus sanguineus TaxID=34632 RepID=UPI0020C28E1B|nr:uncharacterized protein LOC119377808 [Rhipicephalus sanguineus]
MADLRRVHRFRDHTVAGINWRPTRLFDELPSFRVCDLCRMIAKRILVLPCSHVLCQACHAASCQGGGDGLCPMDREPFVRAECRVHGFTAKTARALKVYCWNEAHGCGFAGSTEDLLQHYDKECAFHIIDCFRCGDAVRHRDLSSHYASGCTSGLSSKGAGYSSLESAAAIVRDFRVSLEEMKALLVNPDRDQLMPAIQSRMNKVTQQMIEHESWLAELTREVGASAEADMAQVAASISPKMAGQPRYQRSETAKEASTTSLRQLSPEKSKTCRRPDFFVDLPPDLLQAVRQTSSQDYPQHAVSKCGPQDVKCHLNLTTPLSTTSSWREVQGSVKYVLTLTNGDMDLPITEKIFARLTVLHTRDAYFSFDVDMNA